MLRARDDIAKDARKQHILDCAEQIIQEKGMDRLSIVQVAKKAKLAVGTIYLYFEKKEDIIASLTIKSREMLLQQFQERTAQAPDTPEKVRQLLWAYFDFSRHHPFYHQLVSFYETNAGLEEPEALLEASKNITDFVVDIFREGKKQGSIRPDMHEEEFSFLLWGTAVGVIQLINVKPTLLSTQIHKPTDAFFEAYVNLIISGLK
jgi:AcrR family transcriptional regulator